jgi:flagellar hook-basal body complex protein FliE
MSDLRIDGPSPAAYTPWGRPTQSAAAKGADFQETLKSALQGVNEVQQDSSTIVQRLISGENVDLHEVMMSAEEASIAFELLMEIRNKLLEAYQEIQRMQI